MDYLIGCEKIHCEGSLKNVSIISSSSSDSLASESNNSSSSTYKPWTFSSSKRSPVIGSLIIKGCENRQEAIEWANKDPYFLAGLYQNHSDSLHDFHGFHDFNEAFNPNNHTNDIDGDSLNSNVEVRRCMEMDRTGLYSLTQEYDTFLHQHNVKDDDIVYEDGEKESKEGEEELEGYDEYDEYEMWKQIKSECSKDDAKNYLENIEISKEEENLIKEKERLEKIENMIMNKEIEKRLKIEYDELSDKRKEESNGMLDIPPDDKGFEFNKVIQTGIDSEYIDENRMKLPMTFVEGEEIDQKEKGEEEEEEGSFKEEEEEVLDESDRDIDDETIQEME